MRDRGDADSLRDLAQATAALGMLLLRFSQDLQAQRPAPTPLPPSPPPPNSPLFQRLQRWRTEQARLRRVPPYIVATNAVLQAIETARPRDAEELLEVRGMGPAKVAAYGADILAIVAHAQEVQRGTQ